MSFNAKKCSVMHVLPSSRKHLFQTSYILHGHTLESEEDSKYLSVILNSSIVSKGNLRRNFKECTLMVHSLKFLLRWPIPVEAATYTTIVLPAMEYASSVWDSHQQKHIKALDQVQHRTGRYVCNDYTDRTPVV